jgi:hypothetical protein
MKLFRRSSNSTLLIPMIDQSWHVRVFPSLLSDKIVTLAFFKFPWCFFLYVLDISIYIHELNLTLLVLVLRITTLLANGSGFVIVDLVVEVVCDVLIVEHCGWRNSFFSICLSKMTRRRCFKDLVLGTLTAEELPLLPIWNVVIRFDFWLQLFDSWSVLLEDIRVFEAQTKL